MKNHIKKYFGFTLVELIIVISILIILSTISFVSFQNYTKNTRDVSRLSMLVQARDGINILKEQLAELPKPTNYTTLSGTGGFKLIYQGYLTPELSNLLKFSKVPVDPKSGDNFYYSIDYTKKLFQVGGFFELNNTTFLPSVYADNLYYKSFGDNVGILFDGNNNLIMSGSEILLPTLTGSNYNLYFSNSNVSNLSGSNIVSNIFTYSSNDLDSNAGLSYLDNSLVGYWNFDEGSGTGIIDFSSNHNNGFFSGQHPKYVKTENGYGLEFTDTDSSVIIHNPVALPVGNSQFSFSILLKPYGYGEIISGVYYHKNIFGYGVKSNGQYNGLHMIGTGDTLPDLINAGCNNSLGFGHFFYGGNAGFDDGFCKGMLFDTTKFYYLSYSYDGKVLKTYLNGELQRTRDFSGVSINMQYGDIFFGKIPGFTHNSFNGIIDDFKFYNRSLSGDEIKTLYQKIILTN